MSKDEKEGESHAGAGKGIPVGGNGQCKGPGACLRSNKAVRGAGADKRKSKRVRGSAVHPPTTGS